MITRFFADCLDKEDLPQSIITIAEKKTDKEEASSEKSSVKQTDNAIHDDNRTNNDNDAKVGNEQKDASQETSASQKEDSTTVTTEPNAETVSTTDEKQDIQNSDSNEDNEGDKGNENREYSEDDAFETALFNENSSDYLPEDQLPTNDSWVVDSLTSMGSSPTSKFLIHNRASSPAVFSKITPKIYRHLAPSPPV